MTRADPAQWLSDDEQGQWRAYIVGTELLLNQLDRELRAEHGLSMSEYEILVRLAEAPHDRLRMAVLAQAMCHSRSRVTHTVTRLQRLGFVERRECDDDGRGIEAVLTEAGMRCLVRAAPTHVRGVRHHLIGHAEPEELATLGAVFARVSRALSPDRAEPPGRSEEAVETPPTRA